jgi:hypothetical protein
MRPTRRGHVPRVAPSGHFHQQKEKQTMLHLTLTTRQSIANELRDLIPYLDDESYSSAQANGKILEFLGKLFEQFSPLIMQLITIWIQTIIPVKK